MERERERKGEMARHSRNSLVHLSQNTLRPQHNCNIIILNGFGFSNYLKTIYRKSNWRLRRNKGTLMRQNRREKTLLDGAT